MKNFINKIASISLAATLFAVISLPGFAGEVEVRIEAKVSQIFVEETPVLSGVKIGAIETIGELYILRNFRPAWFGRRAADDLLQQLGRGLDQGFRPVDFHLPLLLELYDRAQNGNADDIANFDIVATDAAARLIHHLIYGKVNAADMDPDWNFSRPVLSSDPVAVLNSYLENENFIGLIDALEIQNNQYQALVDALLWFRQIDSAGGWPAVPDGEVLKPGMTDPRLPALRTRLAISRDYRNGALASDFYDHDLEVAVRVFQARHGLEADGIIGAKTFTALNVSVGERVSQLRLSLERWRWIVRDLGDDYVLVNIAGARTYLVRDGEFVWQTRSIIGTQYRKTPIFRDEISYMEFNPTWTVPVSIFKKDKLSTIRKDPGYLERNGYSVRNAEGAFVSASSVNWNADNPRVTLVQKPGPNNALGLVKFMFPNKYSVYLHDTNNRTLFSKAERNLSSGCVRLEDPFVFANLLMKGDPSWSEAKMQKILQIGATTRVNLPKPMPVLLTYWTAWVEQNKVQFREDIYRRDQKVLQALNAL
ncbi:MAG: L,D-transpeptidase family protein [Paracoccaceae bacterium]